MGGRAQVPDQSHRRNPSAARRRPEPGKTACGRHAHQPGGAGRRSRAARAARAKPRPASHPCSSDRLERPLEIASAEQPRARLRTQPAERDIRVAPARNDPALEQATSHAGRRRRRALPSPPSRERAKRGRRPAAPSRRATPSRSPRSNSAADPPSNASRRRPAARTGPGTAAGGPAISSNSSIALCAPPPVEKRCSSCLRRRRASARPIRNSALRIVRRCSRPYAGQSIAMQIYHQLVR